MRSGNLIVFLMLVTFAHVAVWLQLNSQFLTSKIKPGNPWMLLAGIPISFLWIKATEQGVAAFDGKFWPQRFIAFSVGIVLYTLFTNYFFQEKIDLKSLISLFLAFSIVAIQLFWKS